MIDPPVNLGGNQMEKLRTFAPIISSEEIEQYRHMQTKMLTEDVFCAEDLLEPFSTEEQQYLLSKDYQNRIESLCNRKTDPIRRVFLKENDTVIGFLVYCIYTLEDGKCFILDFYIIPSRRCEGVGSAFFADFKKRAFLEGAAYFELNTHCVRALRFWERQGFLQNGADDYGTILLCLPPATEGELTVERPNNLDDNDCLWQVRKLWNGKRRAEKNVAVTDKEMEQFLDEVKCGRLKLVFVRRGYRVIAMRVIENHTVTMEFAEPAFDSQSVRLMLRNVEKSMK